MTRIIREYWLNHIPEQTILVPGGATILHVFPHEGNIWISVLMNPKVKKEPRHFRLYRSGSPIKEPIHKQYLGTVLIDHVNWYLFEAYTHSPENPSGEAINDSV